MTAQLMKEMKEQAEGLGSLHRTLPRAATDGKVGSADRGLKGDNLRTVRGRKKPECQGGQSKKTTTTIKEIWDGNYGVPLARAGPGI